MEKKVTYFIKKILICSIVFILMFSVNAYASEEKDILSYVIGFANEFCEDYILEISEISPMYDENGKVGYYIKFESAGVPCGYVLYSEKNNEIEEFCFDYGKEGIYKETKEIKEDVLYRQNVLEYNIIDKDSTKEDNMLGAYYEKFDGVFDMVNDTPSVASNSNWTLHKYNYLKNRSMYSEDDFYEWIAEGEDLLEPYACMSIAMLNVCKQCSFIKPKKQSDLVDAYVLLFHLAGTNSQGYAKESVAGYAIQKYAKAICNIDITYTFKRNPSISYFTRAVDNNYSSILGLVGKGNVGHAVSVNGYIKYKNKNTGAIKTYLQVADGWYSRTRCILYNSLNAESTSGTVIEYTTR